MPTHSTTTRPPTEHESLLMARHDPRDPSGMLLGLVLGLGLIFLLLWIHDRMIGRQVPWPGRMVAVLIGLTFTLYWMRQAQRSTEPSRLTFEEDVQANEVVEHVLDNPRSLALYENQRGNLFAMCFEIDDERFLWLRTNEELRGSSFTIVSLPRSGTVLRVEVSGVEVIPELVIDPLLSQYQFRELEIVEGTLDEIRDVLAHEDQKRTAMSAVDPHSGSSEVRH